MPKKTFTAGEVLTAADVNSFLMDQSVMTFATSAARGSAIGTATEGMVSYLNNTNSLEVFDGSAWNTFNPQSGNAIINGAFDIWQRGTSTTGTFQSKTYASDRFWGTTGVSGSNFTISREATNDTSNLPFIQFASRIQRTAGNTNTQPINFAQDLESVTSIPFAGKAVTFSFYARAGANFSGASNVITAQVRSGTGTDQTMASGYSGSTSFISQNASLTTTWQRFTYSGTAAATATQLGVIFIATPTGTAGANDWFEITGVQLEAGPAATPFRRNANSIQGELAACQRYYFQTTTNGGFGIISDSAGATSTSVFEPSVSLPVRLRAYPSALITGGNIGIGDGANLLSGGTFILLPGGTTDKPLIRYTHGSASLTQFRPYRIQDQNLGTAFFAFSAEL